jgi:hypothetical protein
MARKKKHREQAESINESEAAENGFTKESLSEKQPGPKNHLKARG